MPAPQQGTVQPDYQTRGGFLTASFYSGVPAGPSLAGAPGAINTAPDVCIFSGAGRLNLIQPHTNMLSGSTAIVFYDATVMTSGGPFALSGHKILAVVPSTLATASGTVQPVPAWPQVCEIPFQSGLAFNSRSGQPGFTVSYSVEAAKQ